MRQITVGDKELNIEYTFNSFKHMQELDLSALEEAETKPFKVIGVLTDLVRGGVNSNPKKLVRDEIVDKYVERIMTSGNSGEILESLFEELQESDFFQALQAEEE